MLHYLPPAPAPSDTETTATHAHTHTSILQTRDHPATRGNFQDALGRTQAHGTHRQPVAWDRSCMHKCHKAFGPNWTFPQAQPPPWPRPTWRAPGPLFTSTTASCPRAEADRAPAGPCTGVAATGPTSAQRPCRCQQTPSRPTPGWRLQHQPCTRAALRATTERMQSVTHGHASDAPSAGRPRSVPPRAACTGPLECGPVRNGACMHGVPLQ